jgi:hypothetical protein
VFGSAATTLSNFCAALGVAFLRSSAPPPSNAASDAGVARAIRRAATARDGHRGGVSHDRDATENGHFLTTCAAVV